MKSEKLVLSSSAPLQPLDTGLSPKGRAGHTVKCVLFDIYGTLFISSSGDISLADKNKKRGLIDIQEQNITKLLEKYRISCSADSVKQRFREAVLDEHTRLKKNGIDYPELRVNDLWEKITGLDSKSAKEFALEYELVVNPVYPMPGLSSVLKTIKKHNILMGIISNAQFFTPVLFRAFLKNSPEGLGFEKDLLFYSYMHSTAKPSKKLYSMAADALSRKNIASKNTLYIGNDMLNDIYPAKETGFMTALFAGDKRSLRLRENDNRCAGLNPDIIITDLEQLKGHLTR